MADTGQIYCPSAVPWVSEKGNSTGKRCAAAMRSHSFHTTHGLFVASGNITLLAGRSMIFLPKIQFGRRSIAHLATRRQQ